MRIMTSNQNKLAEFRRFRLPFDAFSGPDLVEIDSPDPRLVAIHKAISAGTDIIVEDTSLEIEGANLGTAIRWHLQDVECHIGSPAKWRVCLAALVDNHVCVAEGVVNGTIVSPVGDNAGAFGFDPWFSPNDSDGKTLHELELVHRKDDFSARRRAVEEWLAGGFIINIPYCEILPWQGGWQK
jgi:XTP/dITP diphosphohydrolase